MRIRPHNFMTARKWPLTSKRVAVALVAITFIAVLPALAGEVVKKPTQDPIRITADKLVTNNVKRSAQFTGNVRAAQGKTVITADKLTIFYHSQSKSSPSAGGANIERMKADGHVRIEFDNKVAVSNQAVYIIAERKLVMSGPESKVISGQDEISGSKITFYRDSGQVALEGDDNNRVKAIIHSDQRGLN